MAFKGANTERAQQRLAYILLRSDLSFVEFLLASCYIGWAYILLVSHPFLLTTSAPFSPLAAIAPQWFWGFVFGLTGMFKGVGVLRQITWFRILGGTLGAFLWTFLAVMFLLTKSVPTGTVIYAAFAITSYLIVKRQVGVLQSKRSRMQRNGDEGPF